MDPRTEIFSPTAEPAWKNQLASAIRDPEVLVRTLGLPESLLEPARRAAQHFPLIAPRGFVARMRAGDPGDPLLLQVLPLGLEEVDAPGFVDDPVGDEAATIVPGLLRKYEGRALLIASGACAVHCRYCFRRHFPYEESPRGLDSWQPALEMISSDPSIREVILSGGDPLLLPDAPLERLGDRIAAIGHVIRLRIHTRLPIVIPERITDRLIAWLRSSRLVPFVVVHSNHAAELVGDCAHALTRLVDAGIPVLNQAVLLRGVNDELESLVRLSERLLELRVLPYYLHQLDRVRGAAHFHVDEARGRELVDGLRRCLPGYAVPRYVRETPGGVSKEPV